MNKNKLKSVMALHGDMGKDLAKALGISQQALSAKINERKGAGFIQREILVIKTRYSLSADDIDNIFFK
jgi:DNA-binding XRE family transcriptional regulator